MAASMDNVGSDDTFQAKKRKRAISEAAEDEVVKGEKDDDTGKMRKILKEGDLFAKILKKDDSNLQQALEEFLKSCRGTVKEDDGNVLMQYLEASPQCEDLLDLLNNEDRSELVLLDIFKIIRMILLRFAEDNARYAATALSMVRRIIRMHFRVLMKILTSREWQFQRTALSILTIMATLGQQCAQEVLSELHLNHPYLLKISQMRRDKHKEDPRMLFVQFAMSLFMTESSNIIEKVVANKEFCHGLFQNVSLDRAATIQLLIVTLRDKVLLTNYTSKKTKKHLFNNFALTQLVELYNWKVTSTEEGKKPKEEIDVPTMAHNFLKLICCSTKHGICYSDKSLGLDGRNANLLLLWFLNTVKLTLLLKTSLLEDLFLQIFKNCPDLFLPYLKERETKFTPRPLPDWLNNINLFKKIYSCFPEPNPVLTGKTHPPSSPRLLELVKVTTLPPLYTREQYIQYFKGVHAFVHYGLLDVCKILLEKSQRTLEYCQRQMENKEMNHSSDDWNYFMSGFKESLKEVFPDAEFFVGMFEKYLIQMKSPNKVVGHEESTKKQGSSPPVEIPKPDAIMLRILEVLRLQQTIHPDCLDSSALDLNPIFSATLSVSFIQSLSKEDGCSVRLVKAVMEFLRHLPPKKIRWFKENKKSGSSLFSQVLTLLLSSEIVRSEAEKLLCTILLETGHFDNNEHEAIIWLNTLGDLKSEKAGVIDFLKKAMISMVRNPHPFNDKVADAVTKAHMLKENEGDIHTEIASIADAGIAAILDQEEYTLDCAKDGGSMETETFIDHRRRNKDFVYCSALLPAVLAEYFVLAGKGADDASKESISEYVTMVTMSILNQQRDPVPVSVLIQDCYTAATNSLEEDISLDVKSFQKCLSYCQFWFERAQLTESEEGLSQPKKLKKLKKKLSTYQSFSQLLQDSFLIGSTALCDAEVLTALSGLAQVLQAHKILPTCKQIMLYMQDPKDDNIPSLFGSLVYFLYIILQRANQLDEETQLKEDQVMEVSENISTNPSIPWQEITNTLFENPSVPNWDHYGTSLTFSLDMQSAIGSNSLEKHFLILLDHFFAIKIPSQYFQEIVDNCFAKINSGCLQHLTDLQETANSSNWEEYFQNSDWLGHATASSSVIFKDSISKILEILASSPEFGCKSLTELFLKLPKDLKDLPQTSVTHLVLSVQSLHEENMDKVLSSFLEKWPDVSLKCSVDLLDWSLSSHENKELYQRLAISLITHNPLHRMHFTKLLCTDGGIKQIKRKLKKDYRNFSHVVYSYLSAVAYQTNKSDEDLKAGIALQENLWPLLFKMYCGDAVSLQDGESRLIGAVCKLLDTSLLEQTLDDFCSQGVSELNGARLILIDTLLNELSERDCARLQPIRMTLLSAFLESCSISDLNEDRYQCYKIMLSILEKSSSITPDSKFMSQWKPFVRKGLKLDFQNNDFQNVLKQLLPGPYPDAKNTTGVLPIEKLFNMIINHSSFLPTMLGSDEQNTEDADKIKGHVIASLLFIVKRAPSCCTADHLVVMLGAYGATRSSTDQLLLEMLEVYETNISELDEYRPYLWGQAAVAHYTSRKTVGKNLWTQPTMKEVLDLLDPGKLYETALQFPLDQPLSRQEESTVSLASKESDLYDPSFLLPLFSFLLAPEKLVDCHKFIACNALLLAVVSLSSMYSSMREAGYHILSCFEQHIEGARFRGRREISFLLTCFKNTVPEPNARLPSVITMFVAKSANLMLNPGTSIFKHILQYITIEPKLNLGVIPAFNMLFFSSSEKYVDECNWILQLLNEGLRDLPDFTIYTRNNVWSLLLSFKSSPHCSREVQDTILSIVKKAATIPQAAVALSSSHSLLMWTLASPTPSDHLKTIPILESVLDSVLQFWKKNSSPELSKIVTKVLQEVLLNCQALLNHVNSPGLDSLHQVLLMTQKCLLQLDQLIVNDTNLFGSSCHFSEKSFQNLIQVYQKTTQDPCLCFKRCKAKQIQTNLSEEITVDETVQQDWMTKDSNRETANLLYYLIWYWLKNFSSIRPANATPSGDSVEDLSCLAICWCLNHFARCQGEVSTPKMSDFLKTVLTRLRLSADISKNLANMERQKGTGGSFLSIYNILNSLPVRSEWTHPNCEGKNLIEDVTNQILLHLTDYITVGDAFRTYLAERSKDKKKTRLKKQEHLAVLLRELWSGFENPSTYEFLSAT